MFDQIEGMEQYGDVNKRHQILKAAVEHQNTINPDADIRMIDFVNLKEYLEKNPQEGRYRLLVRIEDHYTAIDVRQHEGKKSCLILDAANDYRCDTLIAPMFVKQQFTVLAAGGMKGDGKEGGPYEAVTANIQTDKTSCSMFALDHCVQLAAAPDEMYENLHDQAELESVPLFGNTFTWDCLPPNFVCNAQSFNLLQRYNAANPGRLNEVMPNGMTMKDYLEQGTKLVLDPNGQPTINEKTGKPFKQNHSINVHVFQKAQAIYQNGLVSAGVPEQSPTLEDSSVGVPEEQGPSAKTEVLKLMNRVILDLTNSTVYGSKLDKDIKLEQLKATRDTYAAGGADTFHAASLHQFQLVANMQRKVINFGGQARSGKVFKAEMAKIREKFQEKAQAGTEKGPLKSGDEDKLTP